LNELIYISFLRIYIRNFSNVFVGE